MRMGKPAAGFRATTTPANCLKLIDNKAACQVDLFVCACDAVYVFEVHSAQHKTEQQVVRLLADLHAPDSANATPRKRKPIQRERRHCRRRGGNSSKVRVDQLELSLLEAHIVASHFNSPNQFNFWRRSALNTLRAASRAIKKTRYIYIYICVCV